jgi:membrane-bound serine protease (ClpP class)
VIDLDDTIQPASLRYLVRGLARAAGDHAALVVIEIDTPGGLLESTREMTSAILASPVPVVVYVAPSGARAASAGFFLVLASDVAAMAPGTNTGAAHPVSIGGSDEKAAPELDKAAKDAAALARSLAEHRRRPVKAAEKAVLESASYSADEAHAAGLVEVIASDRTQLVERLDGRPVLRFDGTTQTLALRGAVITVVDRTLSERVLGVIASPQVAYLLLMLGAIGLLIELTSPGLIVPGVAGAIALLLGVYGFSILPVTLIGGLLIAVGLALLVAEVFVTSFGVLAIAGIASFIVGSLMLVEAPVPELAIGPEVVVPVGLVLAGIVALLAVRAARARHQRVRSGVEAMVGEHGTAISPIDPEHDGKVFVHGEYWNATSVHAIAKGAGVRVDAIDVGLRLRVSPEPGGAS